MKDNQITGEQNWWTRKGKIVSFNLGRAVEYSTTKSVKHIPIECWSEILPNYSVFDEKTETWHCPFDTQIRNSGGRTYLVTTLGGKKL